MFQRSYLWEIRPEEGLMTPFKLITWMNKKTGRNIEYQESMWTFFYSLTIFGAVVGTFYYLVTKFKHVIFKPIFQQSGIQVVFFISIAGIVWNELNNAKWSGVDKNGDASYIFPNSRSQYIAEGLFMSSSSIFFILKYSIVGWLVVYRFYED